MSDAAADEEHPRSRLERLSEAYALRAAEGSGRVHETSEGYSRTVERIFDLSRSMVGIHDRAELLEFVSDGLRELFDAQNSFVVLFDAAGVPRIQSAHTAMPSGATWPVSDTILERVRESRGPLVIADTSMHPDLRDRRSVETLGIASVLCAPLIVEERVIGVLQFDHRGERHSFPIGDLGLLAMFAGQVGTAFRNLELIEELAGALAETRAAQERVVQAERLAALGEMAGGIAHDFNNTLFVTLGTCEMLLAGEALRGRERDAITRIQTCSRDAAETVRRLSVFARGRPSEARERQPVDLREVASEIP